MKFPRILGLVGHDLAIDLGTANTLVYARDRGIVLNEPSVIAIETIGGIRRVRAVGNEAKLMLGKTPNGVQAIRPLRAGVIADIDVAEQMIKHFVDKALGGPRRFRRSHQTVVCVPSSSTKVARRALRDPPPTAAANSTTASRTGALNMGGQLFQVPWPGVSCEISLHTSTLGRPFAAARGIGTIGSFTSNSA